MAITTRQTSLLVQQDWTKLYQTFREADFQSYDYDTLRKSMIDYLRTYYPEDFNDFTESSEYVALIDLIAFLGQSLAFRTDLNARENFIDTAERRDSILKLARLVSYNPKRNIPASGYLKIDSISTTETITDSNGLNLANLLISWNDSANENWLEQFTSIINATLVNTQVVGKPGASNLINTTQTDEYSISIVPGVQPIYKFASTVEGIGMPFEVVSATSSGQNFIYEKAPKPSGAFNMLYRTDNQGNGSPNTGFFLYFKQGELHNLDFTINESLPNRVVNVNFDDINNSDTWLYELTNQNVPGARWTQVPSINGMNIVYNHTTQRNLYQVNTRSNDQIDLVFGDGAFANSPQGSYRLYYRQSNGLNYKITPDEMQAVTISINYVSRTNRLETLTIVASLNYTVSNSSPKESVEDIRTKAPQQYYTQNRMVTGEDYNILPYTTFNNVLKVKAVNRTSSGISRYLDVVDATGKYSSTNIFAADGALYRSIANTTSQFTYSTSNEVYKVLYNVAKPLIAKKEAMHLYHYSVKPYQPNGITLSWTQTLQSSGASTGYFTDGSGSLRNIGIGGSNNCQFIEVGALLKFVPPVGYYFNKKNQLVAGTPTLPTDTTYIYASVNSNTVNSANVSKVIPSGALVENITPVFSNDWSIDLITSMANQILANKNFGLRYSYGLKGDGITTEPVGWTIVSPSNLDMGEFNPSTAGTVTDNSWYIAFTFLNGQYTITQRNLYYYMESVLETRFYFDPKVKVYDSNTGLTLRDHVKVLKTNSAPDASTPLGEDQTWLIYDRVIMSDGFQDTKKILVTFPDENNDGIPDDPTLFNSLVAPTVNSNSKFVFFKQSIDQNSFVTYDIVNSSIINYYYATKAEIATKLNLYQDGQVFYAYTDGVFYTFSGGVLTATNQYVARIGRQDLYFQYRHNSPNNRRIDPSPNNIMDIYMLTKDFSNSYYAWIRDSSNKLSEPVAPTTDELRQQFSELENLKALSDTIIYNPAKFKPIFGAKADPSLRAVFKVVKNPNVSISDNDVKSQLIAAINSYFDINNWDFGETFYFSELSAYLHSKMVPSVSSIIIVPASADSQFGTLFQINAEVNEIIVSSATVDNVQIISAITASQINMNLAG
jgi:hypothetical protein